MLHEAAEHVTNNPASLSHGSELAGGLPLAYSASKSSEECCPIGPDSGDARTFVEIVIWRLDRPMRGSIHKFKYRLALVADLGCVLRYDNEAGKGDHRHIGRAENSYQFADPETLLADFWNDVEAWRR